MVVVTANKKPNQRFQAARKFTGRLDLHVMYKKIMKKILLIKIGIIFIAPAIASESHLVSYKELNRWGVCHGHIPQNV